MLAIAISKYGKPDVLSLTQYSIPKPSNGEVLIKVYAAGVNRLDILQRRGQYSLSPGMSDLLGLEVSGKIVDGDVSESSFRIGDRVCALLKGGGYAEYCVAHATHCLPIPKGWSYVEAASIPESYFTVWSNIFDLAQLSPRETLLVHGGASGIGTAAIQFANRLGHKVYTTVSSQERVSAVEALGATLGINYHSLDYSKTILDITEGKGVNVILDMVAGNYLESNLNCIANDGKIIIIGLLGSTRGNIDFQQVLQRRVTIIGSTLRSQSNTFKSNIARKLHKNIWPLLDDRIIKPVVYTTFPLEAASEAHTTMESGVHIGKIVLTLQHE